MSQQLISLNPDLKRLRDEGYEIATNGGYVSIHHIPFVTGKKEIKFGTLVTELNLASPTKVSQPRDHTVSFAGETPCDKNGSALIEIINNSNKRVLGIFNVDHYFSSKPKSGNYADYYEKFSTYISLLESPAQAIDKSVTARTYKLITDEEDNSVFQYIDTNSSRANIDSLNQKFAKQKIGIIGMGGTGSYLLDFISKTCVEEIHIFDGDDYHVHNAFRNPGATSLDELNKRAKKVDHLKAVYSKLHKGIKALPEYITDNNLNLLSILDFIFISIDDNESRKLIVHFLQDKGIPFIDVGLGVNRVDDSLVGAIRVTTVTKAKFNHIDTRIPMVNNDDNEYSNNIQIAELNAYNAVMAVVKWKKMLGFYQDLIDEYHSTYSINDSLLLNDETEDNEAES